MSPENRTTSDTLFDGDLHCLQHEKGYRFSVDALLLAHFFSPKKGERILDLGAGCGVISLILAHLFPEVSLTSLEIQKPLADLIQKNISLNGFQERMALLFGDLRKINEIVMPESFEQIVCNPPYNQLGCGRLNPGAEEVVARHEIKATLVDVVAAASFALRNKGRASFIYPASRTAALLYTLKKNGLEPKKLQAVQSYPKVSARLILVEARKNGGEEMEVLPPFIIFREPGGEYTEEMSTCYGQPRSGDSEDFEERRDRSLEV